MKGSRVQMEREEPERKAVGSTARGMEGAKWVSLAGR